MDKFFSLILILLSQQSFANNLKVKQISFNNEIGVCKNYLSWQIDGVPEQTAKSGRAFKTVSISPKSELSCVSSFPIPVNNIFVLEATVFMKTGSTEDFVSIYVYETDLTDDNIIGRRDFNASDLSFVNGYQTFKMDLTSRHGYCYVITQ